MPRMHSRPCGVRFLGGAVVASILGTATSVTAQCTTNWLPGIPLPSVDGDVNALASWDPDGAGPAPALLVIAGTFPAAGDHVTAHIATLDPATGAWGALGTGLPLPGQAVAVLANGDLVAASGTTNPSQVVRWDGSTWTPLGGNANGLVTDLLALPNGELIATGAFNSIGGVGAPQIARWNGSVWSAFGTGFPTLPFPVVTGLTTLANGDLVASAAGLFGGHEIARWNGSTWSAITSGASGVVTSLATLTNGDLVAAGSFSAIGGVAANWIARWDGAVWSPLGAGIGSGVPFTGSLALHVLANGDLLVGGAFSTAGGLQALNAARWDGTSWFPVGFGTNDGRINAWATLPNGDCVAGGTFSLVSGIPASRVARWNGTAWSALTAAQQINGSVGCVAPLPGGGVVVGGSFTTIGGVSANRIAHRVGGTFAPLGSGVGGNVLAVTVAPNGDVIAAGDFTTAGGAGANRIARWNGTAWSALGTGMDARVAALTFAPNGDLVAGGDFLTAGGVTVNRIARWNGSAWTAYGPGLSASVVAVAALPNGLIVACHLDSVMRWGGVSWTNIGSVQPPGYTGEARTLLALPDNSFVLGGNFTQVNTTAASRIARWSFGMWSPLGTGVTTGWVYALARLPDGDIAVGGSFMQAGGTPARRIARWNGAWSAMDDGFGGSTANVNGLAFATTGLVAVGDFKTAGTSVSVSVAELASTCPATSAGFGNGCPSSSGTNTLTASMPWVESTLVATGTGLPTTAMIVGITSVNSISQGLVQLANVFVEGIPGCDVLVAPDILSLLTTTTGTATMSTSLPHTPPLVGVTFYQQMIPFELDGSGNVVAITATNALQLTAGRF